MKFKAYNKNNNVKKTKKSSNMRIAKIELVEATNYVGIGATIFFQGCSLNPKCDECHNYSIWDAKGGTIFTTEMQNKVIEHCKKPFIKRLVLCGGNPSDQPSEELIQFIKEFKKQVNKPVIIFDGYTYEELQQMEDRFNIIKECDILIDGRFIKKLYNPKFRFYGSANQRIINIKASLETNKIVLVDIETEIE